MLRWLQDRGGAPQAVSAAAAEHAARQQAADITRSSLSSAEQSLAEALDAEEKLFADHNTDPIALLPVRLETVWKGPGSMLVRVYPDDLHLAQLDPELTAAEADAADEYWRAPGPDAWQRLLVRVRPNRAAWAAHAMRPGAPPPVIRPDDNARPVRTVTMPHHWRAVGLIDGEVVADTADQAQPVRPIKNPLSFDVLGAEKNWIVDFFQAVKNGMGFELSLPDDVDHLDELLVVGVADRPGDAGAQYLHSLLQGHMFGAGLATLSPGTPTNNTPASRSGWSSRPVNPPPSPDLRPEPGGRRVDPWARLAGPRAAA